MRRCSWLLLLAMPAAAFAQPGLRNLGEVTAIGARVRVYAADNGKVRVVAVQSPIVVTCEEAPEIAQTWVRHARLILETGSATDPLPMGDASTRDLDGSCALKVLRRLTAQDTTYQLQASSGGADRMLVTIARSELTRLFDLITTAADSARAMNVTQRAASTAPAYFEFQVERQAALLPDSPTPVYPAALRAAKTSGVVIAQFTVDESGMVEPNSFKVLNSTQPLFVAAVRDVLPRLRFSPAEVQGRRVRQIVQMPFNFRSPE
jgi:TonB family protein